jgi:hypothetical protein
MALLMHRSSVALQECALTENECAHGGVAFAFTGRIPMKTNGRAECSRSARKSELS